MHLPTSPLRLVLSQVHLLHVGLRGHNQKVFLLSIDPLFRERFSLTELLEHSFFIAHETQVVHGHCLRDDQFNGVKVFGGLGLLRALVRTLLALLFFEVQGQMELVVFVLDCGLVLRWLSHRQRNQLLLETVLRL